MNYQKLLKVYLFLVGLLMSVIGGLIAFNPIDMKLQEGIELAGNPSALNDVRSTGMMYLAFAILFFLGSFRFSLRKTAVITASVLFISIGTGRLISMILDGMPSDGIFKGTILELVLGISGLLLFIMNSKKQSSKN